MNGRRATEFVALVVAAAAQLEAERLACSRGPASKLCLAPTVVVLLWIRDAVYSAHDLWQPAVGS